MAAETMTIRAATADDAPAIGSIYAPFVLDSFASFEEVAPDAAEVASHLLAQPRLPWLVAEVAGRVAGFAYAAPHRQRRAYRWSAEVSVYLAPAYHRRGIAGALYERLIAELTELGYVSIFAGIALPNDASVGLHEAVGFEPLGVFRNIGFKDGAWRDVGWWQRALREPPSGPVEPREWNPPSTEPAGAEI